MIMLDTHIWIWWALGDRRLTSWQLQAIRRHESFGLGVSVVSCWEVAKLVQGRKLDLGMPLHDWVDRALFYKGVELLPLTVEIALEATELPGVFHRDPADQFLVATARLRGIPILTQDAQILRYDHVNTISPPRSD